MKPSPQDNRDMEARGRRPMVMNVVFLMQNSYHPGQYLVYLSQTLNRFINPVEYF